MYHERDRNTLELREDKQNARYSLNKLLKRSPQENKNKKRFFSGNSLTGEGLTDANKGVISGFILVLNDTGFYMVFADKL